MFLAKDLETGEKVAIKVEQKESSFPLILYEANILLLMHPLMELGEGFPQVYGMGEYKNCLFMVMEFLGPSLSDLLYFCGG